MISTTEISTQSFSFTANFENISSYLLDKVDLPIDSGKCEFNGITWFLRLFLGGTTYSTTTECRAFHPSFDKFGVYIYNSSHGAVRATYSITLKSIRKNGCMASDIKRTNKRDLLGGIHGYGWPDFASRDNLLLTSYTRYIQNSRYIENGSMKFVCEISILAALGCQ